MTTVVGGTNCGFAGELPGATMPSASPVLKQGNALSHTGVCPGTSLTMFIGTSIGWVALPGWPAGIDLLDNRAVMVMPAGGIGALSVIAVVVATTLILPCGLLQLTSCTVTSSVMTRMLQVAMVVPLALLAVSSNTSSSWLAGAVKLGDSVSAPLSVTAGPAVCAQLNVLPAEIAL